MLQPKLTGLVVAAALALVAVNAHAQAPSDLEPSLVFFELSLRDKPMAKTPEYVSAIQDEIRQYKKFSLLSRKDAYERIRSIMVTPTKRVNDERLKKIGEMVAEGDKLAYTNPKKAIEVLRRAKSQLKELVENISLDSKIRRDYFTTQMLLVRSHLDNGNEAKAQEIMTEIVKTFEDEYPVTTTDYHPQVVQLYEDVSRSLKDERTASITITTNPPATDVYINGRPMRQKTPYTYKGLYPGSIRVNVRKGDLQSMVRKVEVPKGGAAKVDIDLEYESALNFSDQTFGLTFSNAESLKRNMLNYTAKLGDFLDVDYVALVGVIERNGQPVLAGYLIDVKNKIVTRSEDFVVKPNVVSNRRISDMAAFLAGVDPNARPAVAYKPWYTNWVGWTLGGVGVALGGAAAGMAVKRNNHATNAANPNFGTVDDRNEEATNAQDAEVLAGTLAGIGGAALIASVLVFTLVKFEDEEAMEAALPSFYATPVFLPQGAGIGAAFSF